MKKSSALFLLFPLLCSCSGRTLSNEEAYRMLDSFDTSLEQITTFSFYERKSETKTTSTRTTSLYQIFFEKNFIHSYTVNEDDDVRTNNTAVENWVFIRDGMVYEVTTKDASESKKGKVYNAYTYEKEAWESRLKTAFLDIISNNQMYLYRLKNQIKTSDDSTVITSKSRGEKMLNEKVVTKGSDNKVLRTKTYDFEESLITKVTEVESYTTKTIQYQYKITTQEIMYPDF